MAVFVTPLIDLDVDWDGPASTLVGDELFELHKLAAKVGIPRRRFRPRAITPCYHLTAYKRNVALRYGALDAEEWPELYQDCRRWWRMVRIGELLDWRRRRAKHQAKAANEYKRIWSQL